jgi:hypothetical protein
MQWRAVQGVGGSAVPSLICPSSSGAAAEGVLTHVILVITASGVLCGVMGCPAGQATPQNAARPSVHCWVILAPFAYYHFVTAA